MPCLAACCRASAAVTVFTTGFPAGKDTRGETMKRRLIWTLAGIVAVAGIYAATLLATDASGFTGTTVAVARFGEIDVKNHTIPASIWQSRLQTQGESDVYIQSNVWAPGGHTGWHTHPGHSLILVTTGTVTAYDGDDPTCTPHVYMQGQGFVDHGGDHVHIIRNEGPVEARTMTVQLIPAGAGRRIGVPAPGNCPF